MSNLKINEKFEPLFRLLDDNYFPEVDTVIMTGGRYSLKSFTVSIFSLIALVDFGWNILYTRFTNESITDSVKPEVSDKIELMNYQGKVKDLSTHIETSKNRIAFKGIRTGSKAQTANLKSLSGFNLFVNDEAEELPDLKTFKKIFYSIRDTTRRNLSILILNPTTKEHWIFREFFESKGLEGGDNCIVDNVMYIHTSYLDCDFDQMPKNILADYRRMEIENPAEYENIVLGGWITEPEGVLLPKSKLNFVPKIELSPENILFRFAVGDPADQGGDKYSMPFIYVCGIGDRIVCYMVDVIHSTFGIEANTERINDKINELNIESVFVESNGVGLAALILLKKIMKPGKELIPFNSSVNKQIRIYSNYEFIAKHFIFDQSRYTESLEYRQYINDLTNYQKEGDNKHRIDAIDSLCSAAKILKLKYRL